MSGAGLLEELEHAWTFVDERVDVVLGNSITNDSSHVRPDVVTAVREPFADESWIVGHPDVAARQRGGAAINVCFFDDEGVQTIGGGCQRRGQPTGTAADNEEVHFVIE